MSYEESPTDVINISSENGSFEEESFASLLEKSTDVAARLRPGQRVKAKVVSISGDLVYIDLGGKSEGIIDLSEFQDKDGAVHIKEGDDIEAFFLSVNDGMKKMTTMRSGYSAGKLNNIKSAHEASLPVNGIVKREVKGGFEISVGDVRCFCPYSQIDLKAGREGGIYLGQTFPFKIMEFEDDGRNINIIVSRRALLEDERQSRIEKLKQTLEIGTDVKAVVRSIQNFGVFADLGGIDGLIPASELSWLRVEKTGDLLSVGQEVTARIISLDWEKNRLTLSIKATQPDPWAEIGNKYAVDSRINGTVVRLTAFGAFVNLEPGIDGLIHISNLGAGRRINHPKEVVEVGQLVEAYVLSVDTDNRKISLSMRPKPRIEKIVLPAVGESVDGVVEKVMPYGIFLKISNGLTGLIPNAEMGTPTGSDHKRMFPAGMELKAVVLEVDTKNNKVRLSRKAAQENEVQEEYKEYISASDQAVPATKGLGSLGEILRAKLEEKRLNN